jgi:PleD family two-component response regulator
MTDELREQYFSDFVAETRTRLRAAMSLIPPAGPGDAESAKAIAAMMESITGAAMLIGLSELALLGRAAAAAARRYLEINNDAALVSCARTLRTLARAVEKLGVPTMDSTPAAAVSAENSALSQIKILIVDDSPLNAALLRDALVNQGFDASCVGDDFDLVIQRLKDLRPQVLLVDWLMPGCDTRKLCRRIRSTTEFGNLRVLLITSIQQQEAARLAASMGIDGALSKEQGIAAIVESVRAVARDPLRS